MEKSDFRQLINKAKKTSNNTVTQKVIPVRKKTTDEVQFSFYINKSVLKQLKLKALETESSIKSIINTSIKNYLEKG